MSSDNGICFNYIFKLSALIIIVYLAAITSVQQAAAAPSTTSKTTEPLIDECGHRLERPPGFIARHFDYKYWKKFFKHWIPFTSSGRVKMNFYLYKKDFPECGRKIDPEDENTLEQSGFNADHQTRFIIHGWLSQGRGRWYRAIRDAYLNLTKESENFNDISATKNNFNETKSDDIKDTSSMTIPANYTDFNIIVVDWSPVSTNINYFSVVDLIDDLGFLLAEFVRYLNLRTGLHYDDIYLIGHSLGAHIAGSAGKQVKPFLFNTIFALDPAGPKFRDSHEDQRLDPSDAKYVESIQTSDTFGFTEPIGNATFYPNFGHDQKKCHKLGCSHSRAHDYFAESITSKKGFWGTLAKRETDNIWVLSDSGVEFRMGGEPSIPKQGTFYVKTNDLPPYAMGRNSLMEREAETTTEIVMLAN